MNSKSFPEPVPGLVIRYSYFWHAEQVEGREDGRKDRPCAVVLALTGDPYKRVVVLPITHTPPETGIVAMEIPWVTKRRLGLDEQPSWIVMSEASLFKWPGPDLRPGVNGDLSTIVYGLLPDAFFKKMRKAFVESFRVQRIRVVARTQ